MRLAARKDANKDGIVKALREAGFMVYDLKQPVDLLVWDKGSTWKMLMELKDGNKPPSARGLTDAQMKLMEQGLPFCIATDAEGALRAAMMMRNAEITGARRAAGSLTVGRGGYCDTGNEDKGNDMSRSLYASREDYEAAQRGPDGGRIANHELDCTNADCGWSGLASQTGDNWMDPKCPCCGAPTTPSEREAER